MANAKHEDAVMKMGFDYFRNTILKTLGIDYQYEEIGPTELVELTIQSLYMDFTFLTTGGFYIHTEFQTTDKKEADLRRFHAYDAVYSNKTGKKVITYVIYSGGITNVKSELDCGLYTYRVQPIYLKDKNADEVFRKLYRQSIKYLFPYYQILYIYANKKARTIHSPNLFHLIFIMSSTGDNPKKSILIYVVN